MYNYCWLLLITGLNLKSKSFTTHRVTLYNGACLCKHSVWWSLHVYWFVVCIAEVCKSNNVTDHQQAMDDAAAAAVLQQANRDVMEEADTAADNSDEQQLTDDQMPALEDTELTKEDLWWVA